MNVVGPSQSLSTVVIEKMKKIMQQPIIMNLSIDVLLLIKSFISAYADDDWT